MAHTIHPDISRLFLDLQCGSQVLESLGAPESWRDSCAIPELQGAFSNELLQSLLLHWDWQLGRPRNAPDIEWDHSVAELNWTGYADWTKWDSPAQCLRRPKQALTALAEFIWPGSLIQWHHSIDHPGASSWGYTTWLFDGQNLLEIAYLKDWGSHPTAND